jgi:DNA modification methylase
VEADVNPYYEDESVTIYHGDARGLIPESGIDIVFTSPPYNKGLRGDHRNGWVGKLNTSARIARFGDGYGATSDMLPWDEYFELMHSVLGAAWAATNEAGAMWVNHKPRVWLGGFWSPLQVLPAAIRLRQIVIWNRGGGIDCSDRGFASAHEWLMFCPKPDHRVSLSESGRGDVWSIPQERSEYAHPAPFPVALPKRALAGRPLRAVVLDPFMGTGTTLRAAVDVGLRAIGIDTEERYCEIAAKRMSQLAMTL